MTFDELPSFTKRVDELLDEESYIALQLALLVNPEAGDLIVHGGGLRKIRWAAKGRGKSGGLRVIYYWRTAQGIIVMGMIYPKNEKENLTSAELGKLRKEIGI